MTQGASIQDFSTSSVSSDPNTESEMSKQSKLLQFLEKITSKNRNRHFFVDYLKSKQSISNKKYKKCTKKVQRLFIKFFTQNKNSVQIKKKKDCHKTRKDSSNRFNEGEG